MRKKKGIIGGFGFSITESYSSNEVPDTFKVGRDAQLQLSKVEHTLFEKVEQEKAANYIISGVTRKISESDFLSFQFAVEQILYNQSYIKKNLKTNSGLTQTQAIAMTEESGSTFYVGNIVATLNDLCRLAYGVAEPSTQQRAAMSSLIDTLHNNPVVIQYPNGYTRESVLCARMDTFKGKDGAITYNLHLNPIFCSNVERNFAELPQDFMYKLNQSTERKTAAHLRLVRLLSMQDKRKPCVRYIPALVEEIGMGEQYKNQRTRTENQLRKMFEAMVNVGILSTYEISEKIVKGKPTMEKVKFCLIPKSLPS